MSEKIECAFCDGTGYDPTPSRQVERGRGFWWEHFLPVNDLPSVCENCGGAGWINEYKIDSGTTRLGETLGVM